MSKILRTFAAKLITQKIHTIMAKFYGNIVKTGRLGGSVFRIRAGETIESQYQPVVYNPSTEGQMQTRAKLKMMSQLAAVMAPVIAIPRRGAVSSRNLFVKTNYPLTGYTDSKATITLDAVQLTQSAIAFPAISGVRGEGKIVAYIANAQNIPTPNVDRVVYAVFDKQSDGRLRFLGSEVVTSPGSDGGYTTSNLPISSDEVVILGYGIRDNTMAAKATFGNMQAITAETVAQLIVSSHMTESDVTLTETRGYTLAAANV